MNERHICEECGEPIREGDPLWIDPDRRHFHARCHQKGAAHIEAVARSKRAYAAWIQGQRQAGVTDGVSDG